MKSLLFAIFLFVAGLIVLLIGALPMAAAFLNFFMWLVFDISNTIPNLTDTKVFIIMIWILTAGPFLCIMGGAMIQDALE